GGGCAGEEGRGGGAPGGGKGGALLAPPLQNMAGGLGIGARRAGLAAPHAGCRVPGRLRILPATRYTTVSTNPAWARTSRQRRPSRAPLPWSASLPGRAPSVALLIVLARPRADPSTKRSTTQARLSGDALTLVEARWPCRRR